MATASDAGGRPGFVARKLAIAGPLAAQAAVWLTTAGHTANFREMNDARGWIPSVGFGLHAAYLFAVAASILIAPALRRAASSHALAVLGLGLLAAGSLLSGLNLHATYDSAVAARVLAGFGAGQALVAAPRLLPAARPGAVDLFEVLLPALGPPVIALASVSYGWSDWEGAFLFEAVLAAFGLACVVPLDPAPDPPPRARGSVAYWPALVVGLAGVWYLLHWGHLSGWGGDRTVLLVGFGGAVALTAALWLAWPGLPSPLVREAVARGTFVGYAGMVQFFQVAETGIFGGLFINVGEWERACQILPLGLGAAVSLLAGRLTWRATRPGRLSTAVGLLTITAGMAFAHAKMVGWPFWSVQNVVEFNWFAAPQTWEMAPGRFLVGFGFGLVILSETHRAGRDPAREARVEVGLHAAQFLGAGVGIGLLATALLAGHQWEYSYAADRGAIQAPEVAGRTARLGEAFAAGGAAEPGRRAETLMFRSVNYQADVLVFAHIYAGFGVTSAALAAALLGRMAWRSLAPGRRRDAPVPPGAGSPVAT
jgi:hypothetical protein